MSAPKLSIYIDGGERLCFEKNEPNKSSSHLMVDIDLNELRLVGEKEAACRIGIAIIGVLRTWHKDSFIEWGEKDNFNAHEEDGLDSREIDDYDVALHLIEKSVAEKTSSFVIVIESLLANEAAKRSEVGQFLEESWPIIRKRLNNLAGEI
jgi:hypothetical protein